MTRNIAFLILLPLFIIQMQHNVCAQTTTVFQLEEATIEEINQAFDNGLLTSERLVQMYLNRIEAYNQHGPKLNTIITLNSDALETARMLDAERSVSGARSPLHGIPILIKDIMDVAGMPTSGGIIGLKDSIPPDDSFVVQRLRDAGAIILGKTNTDDLAEAVRGFSSVVGHTKNPYDILRVPGGSSGGTAAAIAANFAVIGTGTDSWGSIRLPSSLNSLVGLRPTLGLVSRDGTIVDTLSRDTIGPIGRTVKDVAIFLDIIAGFDPADPETAMSEGHIPASYLDTLNPDGMQGVRIGIARRFLTGADAKVITIFNEAIAQFQTAGAIIVDPFDFAPQADLSRTLYHGFEFHMNNYLESLGESSPFASVQELAASGQYSPHLGDSSDSFFKTLRGDMPPEEDPLYISIMAHRAEVEQGFLNAIAEKQVDIVVYPTITQLPPFIPTSAYWPNTSSWRALNVSPFLGLPSISVPAGFTSEGLPVGVEFLACAFQEPELLRVAYAYEQATLHRRSPSSAPPLLGEIIYASDYDDNGQVDGNDFLIWQRGFNHFNGDATRTEGDADGNGFVNENDFLIWLNQYGSSNGLLSRAIPEPASVSLLLILTLSVLILTRWRMIRRAGC